VECLGVGERRCRCVCGGLIDECGVNCAVRVFVYEFAGVSLCVSSIELV